MATTFVRLTVSMSCLEFTVLWIIQLLDLGSPLELLDTYNLLRHKALLYSVLFKPYSVMMILYCLKILTV